MRIFSFRYLTISFFNNFFRSLLLFLILSSACSNGDQRLTADVSKIILPEVVIHRYDIDLFHVNRGQLQKELEVLKPAYRFFLDTDLNNPAKLSELTAYLENPRNLAFQEAVSAKFKDLCLLYTSPSPRD